MHFDSLSAPVAAVWNRLGALPSDFVLVGGTALALQWGHRVSYDLDFATSKPLPHPRTILRALGLPADRRRYKWPRKKIRPHIHISPTDNTPKVDIHGKVNQPWLVPPRRAPNGLLIANPADILWHKAVALTSRDAVRDAVDICEWRRDPRGIDLSAVLNAVHAVSGNTQVGLADFADALLDDTNHAAWDAAGVDVGLMSALGEKVLRHTPRPPRFASVVIKEAERTERPNSEDVGN